MKNGAVVFSAVAIVCALAACSSSSSNASGDAGGGGGACCLLPDGVTLAASECDVSATALNVKSDQWVGQDTNGNQSCTIDPNNPCYPSLNETDGGLGKPIACPCYTRGADGGRVDGTMKACH